MAIIYSYPIATPKKSDLLLGSQTDQEGIHTKSFYIDDISKLVYTPTLQDTVEQGATSILPISITTAGYNQSLLVNANGGKAIEAYSSNDNSIYATSDSSATAIYGQAYTEGVGVQGLSVDGAGVFGTSVNAEGIYGSSVDGIGAKGTCESGSGVFGSSSSGYGVEGTSIESYGVYAVSATNFGIYANSAVKIGGGVWSTFSDQRVKENIVEYTKGLQEILQVNTVVYDYNGLGNIPKSKDHIGIIAQEIQNIFPETITTQLTLLNETDVDKTELLVFDGSPLTYALINAVKELNTEIQNLKFEIVELKLNQK